MEAGNYEGELSSASRLRVVSGALSIKQRNPAHMDLQFRKEQVLGHLHVDRNEATG